MSDQSQPPIDVDVGHANDGSVRRVSIRFGPHHRVEVSTDGATTSFVLLYTHHGFSADASVPGGELERIIEQIRAEHPGAAVD
jgi:hypothetical protein